MSRLPEQYRRLLLAGLALIALICFIAAVVTSPKAGREAPAESAAESSTAVPSSESEGSQQPATTTPAAFTEEASETEESSSEETSEESADEAETESGTAAAAAESKESAAGAGAVAAPAMAPAGAYSNPAGRMPSGHNTIYLCFTIGSELGYTGQLMDILASRGVKATFFITVHEYLTNRWKHDTPALAGRMAAEGHTIGCHGYTHVWPYQLSDQQLRDEVSASRALLNSVLGYDYPLTYYTPPYEYYYPRDVGVVQSMGMIYVSQTFAVSDRKNPTSAQAYATLCSGLADGQIYFLHPNGPNTGAMAQFLDYAISHGYQFVALGNKPVVPVPESEEPETTEEETEETAAVSTEEETEATAAVDESNQSESGKPSSQAPSATESAAPTVKPTTAPTQTQTESQSQSESASQTETETPSETEPESSEAPTQPPETEPPSSEATPTEASTTETPVTEPPAPEPPATEASTMETSAQP